MWKTECMYGVIYGAYVHHDFKGIFLFCRIILKLQETKVVRIYCVPVNYFNPLPLKFCSLSNFSSSVNSGTQANQFWSQSLESRKNQKHAVFVVIVLTPLIISVTITIPKRMINECNNAEIGYDVCKAVISCNTFRSVRAGRQAGRSH